MRIGQIITALIVAALCCTAFLIDGASIGAATVSAAILGVGAYFSAKKAKGGWALLAVGLIYLSSLSLVTLSVDLIDKALGAPEGERLLSEAMAIPAVFIAFAICQILLGTLRRVTEPMPQSSSSS